MKIYLETNKCLVLTSAKFHVICCTETVFLERVLLLSGHTSYLWCFSSEKTEHGVFEDHPTIYFVCMFVLIGLKLFPTIFQLYRECLDRELDAHFYSDALPKTLGNIPPLGQPGVLALHQKSECQGGSNQ